MSNFEQMWMKIQTILKQGMKIPNWTINKGYFGNDVFIEQCTKEYIHFRSPTAKYIQIVPKEDFEKVWGVWPDYLLQRVARFQIRDMTRFSRYIINTFHFLENIN